MGDVARPLRSAVAWSAAALGFYAAYFVSTAVPTPLPWYYPLAHRFAFEVRPTGLAADYYGRVLLCVLAAALAFVFAWVIGGKLADDKLPRALRITSAWAAALLLFTAAMYVYLLYARMPFPAPLPPDYVPR